MNAVVQMARLSDLRDRLPFDTPVWQWAPDPSVFRKPSTTVIVSRQGHDLSSETPWIRSVVAAIEACDPGAVFIAGCEELPAKVARRAAWEHGHPIIDVKLVPPGRDGPIVSEEDDVQPHAIVGVVAPGTSREDERRLRDRVILALSDRITGVALRPGGNWRSLLEASKVEYSELPGGKVEPFRPPIWQDSAPDGNWDYLTHFTRRPMGPWPGESEAAYLRGLVTGTSGARGPLEALRRIVATETIQASAEALRGGPCVCFTACPPNEWPGLEWYHRGRHRPRYEPYGIAVRKSVLERLGARPVSYGNGASRDPWFQSEGSGGRWRAEREWRLLGSLDLRAVDRADLLLIVPVGVSAGASTFSGVSLFRAPTRAS